VTAAAARFGVLALLAIVGVDAGAAVENAEVDPGRVRIGVARFESAGPPGVELPDIATLLSDRIGTRGVGRIVGPSEFGVPAMAHAEASEVKVWSQRAQVDSIVTGRTTQIGNALSLDVRLLSGSSGALVDTFIAEVTRADQIASAVDTLASQVVEGALALIERSTASVKQASGAVDSEASVALPFDSSAPISIKSNTLEATDVNGRRRLVFSGDVRVHQADVDMTSDRLTADYPEGSSQPSLLVATGSVRVVQGTQEARCDDGTYRRADEVLVCCGHAELRDGPNRVRGKCIEFDLSGDTVRVEDATVNIFPEQNSGNSGEATGGGQ
jgi:lipopolysaccharide transport protein LptA